MRRIVGQCNQADFVSIEHLASITEDPEKLDTSTLKRKEMFAFIFLTSALRKGINWELLRDVVKEVLFWGENEHHIADIEIRLVHDYSKLDKIKKFKQLWS